MASWSNKLIKPLIQAAPEMCKLLMTAPTRQVAELQEMFIFTKYK